MLVEASENEEDKYKLNDDSEVIGNVFVMLFARHKITAHTIAATLGLIAYYHDDIQREIYQNIISVIGHGVDPVYNDYPKLNKVLSTFFEALRMFPSGFILVKQAFEEAVLQVPNARGEEGSQTVILPKGTNVAVDMVGTITLDPLAFVRLAPRKNY